MRSEKQREASCLNAATSKCPTTHQGKGLFSRSRASHGLLAHTLVLDAESASAPPFDKIRPQPALRIRTRQVVESKKKWSGSFANEPEPGEAPQEELKEP